MTTKLVLIIDKDLPLGLIANTAAYLSLAMGQWLEPQLEANVPDAANREHLGTVPLAIPILSAERSVLTNLREQAYSLPDVLTVDFSNAAQSSLTYAEYQRKLTTMPLEDVSYLGLACYGPKKLINKLTGSLALLR
ncbi:MAG: DUF2000 domain-containing protein [Deinococcota bacterium]